MIRTLVLLAFVVAVITAVSASAAHLIVDPGTLQVVDIRVIRPIPDIGDDACEETDDAECDDDDDDEDDKDYDDDDDDDGEGDD